MHNYNNRPVDLIDVDRLIRWAFESATTTAPETLRKWHQAEVTAAARAKKKHRKASDMDIKKLITVATGEIPHNYRSGLCPDELQPDSRPGLPSVQILIDAAAEYDEMERRMREAEGHVHARIDEAVEAEREACAKLCESEWSTEDERKAGQIFAREIRALNKPGKATNHDPRRNHQAGLAGD